MSEDKEQIVDDEVKYNLAASEKGFAQTQLLIGTECGAWQGAEDDVHFNYFASVARAVSPTARTSPRAADPGCDLECEHDDALENMNRFLTHERAMSFSGSAEIHLDAIEQEMEAVERIITERTNTADVVQEALLCGVLDCAPHASGAEKSEQRSHPARQAKEGHSRFCHVCSRKGPKVLMAVCVNYFIDGRCRKVFCDRCLRENGVQYDDVVRALTWVCFHCENRCPRNAKCKIYSAAK
mmetsp:Transcript_12283/g.33148  ORF Transcript_12283/g.33148 Transcript_12283/m.33148 type:complete len:240 (+) Transcript_12283:612-1331(+)